MLSALALSFANGAQAQAHTPPSVMPVPSPPPAVPLTPAPTAPAAAPATTPPPSASAAGAPAPAAAALPGGDPSVTVTPTEPTTAAECYPACREGYLCHQGQCISACNPACAAHERCTAQAQCVADAPPPPPAYLEGALPPAPPGPQGKPRPARAPEPPESGVHEHDGFLLRFTLGFGGGAVSATYRGDLLGTGPSEGKLQYAGGGVLLGLDLGGAMSSTLSVYGRLSFLTLSDPSLHVDGADYEVPDGTVVNSTMLAVGLTYTFMPLNLYLSTAVGITGITVRDDDPDSDDRAGSVTAGPGVDFDVGKEWWASTQLGIGLALRLSFRASEYADDFHDQDRSYLGAGLLFSLAYQ